MDSEFFQKNKPLFSLSLLEKAWEVLCVSFWVSKGKRCNPWQEAQSLRPQRSFKPGVPLLTNPARGSFPVSCLLSQSPQTIFDCGVLAPKSATATSLLCESGWALFLCLMERLCIIQLNIFAQRGRAKSHCSKGTFPLLFQQHYVIAHGTGSADSLLILCSQRTDQGDPRLSSSWPVSSMVQMKILTLTPGWSPAHVCSPTLTVFNRSTLVSLMPSAFSKSTVVFYSSYVQVGFLCKEVQREVWHSIATTETKQEKDGSNFCSKGQWFPQWFSIKGIGESVGPVILRQKHIYWHSLMLHIAMSANGLYQHFTGMCEEN